MSSFSHAAPSAISCCVGDTALCAELARQLAEMEEAGTYAPLAGDVYSANDPDAPDLGPPAGWSRKSRSPDEMRALLGNPNMSDGDIKDLFEPEGTSYRAMLYENDESGDLVLAYRGTVTGEDWKNNALQGAGMQSEHYERAKDLASTLDLAAEENGKNLTITGHSLGGGMAGAAALWSGRKAVTFNPAGVHPNTVPGFNLSEAPKQITDYVVDGDALNHVVQDNRDTIRAGVSGVAGMAGNALAGPGGGLAASRGTSYATRDAIPQNAGKRISLPDTTAQPEGAWYSPSRWKGEVVHASGYKQHLMPAVTDGIAQKKAELEKKMSDAGC